MITARVRVRLRWGVVATVCFGLGGSVRANSECHWASQWSASGRLGIWSVAAASDAAFCVAGEFTGSAVFGDQVAESAPDGAADGFVARFSATGELIWARPFGGFDLDSGYGVATDGAGNVYVTGILGGEALVAKYGPGGAELWTRRAASTFGSRGQGIAVDPAGNASVSGTYEGAISFDGGQTTLTNAGSSDVFICRFDSEGRLLWARAAGGAAPDYGVGMGVDAAGNSYLSGSFFGAARFGPTNVVGSGDADVFLAKYSSSGQLLWVRAGGSAANDELKGSATDGAGNSVIVGRFESAAARFGGIELPNSGGNDLFTVRYDPEGAVVWGRRFGGAGEEIGLAVALDASTNVVVAASADFDLVLLGYDLAGGELFSSAAHGALDSDRMGVAIQGPRQCLLAGSFFSDLTFGSLQLFNGDSGADGFVAQQGYLGPPNDNFARRSPIDPAVRRVSGDNVEGGKEEGEPDHAGNSGGRSVWWKWTAPRSGLASISTAGSDFSAVLAVYTGDSLGTLVPVASDYTYGRASTVVFAAVAGVEYQIAVDSFRPGFLSTPCPEPGRIMLTAGFPPVVDITSPGAGLTTGRGTNVVFSAVATDPDGPPPSLVLYEGTTELGRSTNGTLTLNWSTSLTGSRPLRAVATDRDGFVAEAGPVFVSVGLALTGPNNLNTQTNATSATVDFSGRLTVSNLGEAPGWGMRVRLVAQAGYSYDPFASNGPVVVPADRELGVAAVTPAVLDPGALATLDIAGVCPAPEEGADFWYAIGWGVFAVLETRVGDSWLVLDRRLILYGVWPSVSSQQGPGGGVIRLDPPNASLGLVAVSLLRVTINGPSQVAEGSTARYWGTAFYDDNTSENFTNTQWAASSFAISTNGVFSAGNVTADRPVNLACAYVFGASSNWVARTATVLNLPAPAFTNVARGPQGTILTLQAVPARLHAIESSTNLGPGAIWRTVATNRTSADGLWRCTNDAAAPRQFYRARELE